MYSSGSSISFFALLISACTDFSENCLSSIWSSFKHFFTIDFWSEVSNIIKLESNPSFSICFLKIFTQIEWNVPIHISFDPSPTNREILSFISFAALFVKVIARISQGSAFFSPIIYAILCVKTLVFPLPAPAITKTGPSVFTTASYCLSFNPFNISCIKNSIPFSKHTSVYYNF